MDDGISFAPAGAGFSSARRRKSETELIDIDKEMTFRNVRDMETEQPVSILLQLASTLVHSSHPSCTGGAGEFVFHDQTSSDVSTARRQPNDGDRNAPEILVSDVEAGVVWRPIGDDDVEDDGRPRMAEDVEDEYVTDNSSIGRDGSAHAPPAPSAGIQLVKALAARIASEDDHAVLAAGRLNVSSSPTTSHAPDRFIDVSRQRSASPGRSCRSNVTVYDLLSATNIIMEADASVWERKVRR
jgi:hypothetical protein